MDNSADGPPVSEGTDFPGPGSQVWRPSRSRSRNPASNSAPKWGVTVGCLNPNRSANTPVVARPPAVARIRLNNRSRAGSASAFNAPANTNASSGCNSACNTGEQHRSPTNNGRAATS